uniref:Putative ixodes 10 kDa peptide protein n=1 Tax=Ixodes ricinus TaxID=34613 RepID=A0A0K8R4Y3_IXORI
MYRIISNMLLVLFAVALGLPASKGKESSNSLMECYRAVKNGGDILCQLRGYGNYKGLTYYTCELECGNSTVKLPQEACPNSRLHKTCNQDDLEHLRKWNKKMVEKKDRLMKIWCKA